MSLYYFIICHIAFAVILFAAYVISRFGREDADNKYISLSFYIISAVLMVRTLSLYSDDIVSSGVSAISMFVGMFSMCTYGIYPLVKMYPERHSGWRLLRIYAFFYVALIGFYVSLICGVSFEYFDLLKVLSGEMPLRFDILYRVFFMILSVVLSFTPAVLSVRNKSTLFLKIYSWGITIPGLCILFLFLFPSLFYGVLVAYQVWVCIFPLLIAGLVCFRGKKLEEKSQREVCESTLWLNIEKRMREEEPWRKVDFKLERLSELVYSNRTSVSEQIRSHGFKTFQDYVAKYRVEAFCLLAQKEHISNISEAFFSVGFRSATTAFNHFKNIKNQTPGSYLEQLARK